MIELAASVSTPPRIGTVAPVGAPATGDFLALLAGMLGGGETEPALTVAPGKRQPVAGDGKGLPDDAADEDAPKELSWLPVGLVSPVPVPTPIALALPQPGVTTLVAGEAAAPSPTSTPVRAGAKVDEAAAQSLPSPDWTPASAKVAAVGGTEVSLVTTDLIASSATKDGVPAPRTLDVAKGDALVRVNAPVPQLPQPPLTQPAGQAFATAIAAAVQAQSHRGEREADTRAPIGMATAALEAVHTPAITATPDAKQVPLDLRQDRGLQGMIDHIEVLRDGADANDTRIRLVPDALGAVDVSVRKDGDRVHVHFSAENAASARLIAEAQPRLADLAEARGVRLGDTSVDSGTGDARRPPAPMPVISTTPVSVTESDDLSTDIRIA